MTKENYPSLIIKNKQVKNVRKNKTKQNKKTNNNNKHLHPLVVHGALQQY